MEAITARFGATALRRALLFGVIGAILTSFMVAQAVTSTNLGSSTVKLAFETFSDDADVTVTAVGIGLVSSNTAAAGDTAPGVEIVDTLPAVNNALTKNNYFYRFNVQESGVATLQSAENLKIELYGDDGTTTSLLATLYTQQVTVDDVNVEGAQVTVDVGSTVHDTYDIVVSRQ